MGKVKYSHLTLALSYLCPTIAQSCVSAATFTDNPNSLTWVGSTRGSGYRHFPKVTRIGFEPTNFGFQYPRDIMYSGFNRSAMRP